MTKHEEGSVYNSRDVMDGHNNLGEKQPAMVLGLPAYSALKVITVLGHIWRC
jgi:hypothetical protein